MLFKKIQVQFCLYGHLPPRLQPKALHSTSLSSCMSVCLHQTKFVNKWYLWLSMTSLTSTSRETISYHEWCSKCLLQWLSGQIVQLWARRGIKSQLQCPHLEESKMINVPCAARYLCKNWSCTEIYSQTPQLQCPFLSAYHSLLCLSLTAHFRCPLRMRWLLRISS